jgi:hypothetical protein
LDARALRFFGTADGLEIFVDFATSSSVLSAAGAAVLATLADRRRDMLMGRGKSCGLVVLRSV